MAKADANILCSMKLRRKF